MRRRTAAYGALATTSSGSAALRQDLRHSTALLKSCDELTARPLGRFCWLSAGLAGWSAVSHVRVLHAFIGRPESYRYRHRRPPLAGVICQHPSSIIDHRYGYFVQGSWVGRSGSSSSLRFPGHGRGTRLPAFTSCWQSLHLQLQPRCRRSHVIVVSSGSRLAGNALTPCGG